MTRTSRIFHTASSVAQDNKGRVQSVSRGLCSKNMLQSTEPTGFNRNFLRILQCNINGLCTPSTRVKLDQLLDLANQHHVQIIAIQETKLNSSHDLKLKGYSILRLDRPSKGGGGLMFLIRNANYEIHTANPPQGSDLEIQAVKVKWKDKFLNIYNAYQPPSNQRLPSDALLSVPTETSLFLGDLNAKHPLWGSLTPNQRGIDLSDFADNNSFCLLNDGTPTHCSYSYNCSDALDITLASPDIFPSCSWTVMESVGSDHLPILIELKHIHRTPRCRKLYWNFKKANWDLFKSHLDSLLNQSSFADDLEGRWQYFSDSILKAAKQAIPRGNRGNFKPGFLHQSEIILSLLQQRNALQANMMSTSSPDTRSALNAVNAKIKRLYAHLKRERWNKLCENLDSRIPNSKLWKLAKNIERLQPQFAESNSLSHPDGTLCSDNEAANLLGSHYQSESRLSFNPSDKLIAKSARDFIHKCRCSSGDNPLFNNDFSHEELDVAFHDLVLGSSPGLDGIHGHMLANLSSLGRDFLLDLFNLSWSVGRLPRGWKTALVIPIKKPDKPANDLNSFRPIALTSITCKLMERLILRRLSIHLNINNMLPSEQYGFRKGHGTMDQVLYFGQMVRDAQNLRPTHHTVAALLDLSKAFDRVWKNKLLNKLYRKFNISGKALPWISDFLKARYIRVKYNDSLSRKYNLSQGIPQGSVLSPTLFSLFVAGIEAEISGNCCMGLYADDIIIWSSNSCIPSAQSDINSSLLNLQAFAENHKLVFNPHKSSSSLFTTNRHLYNMEPDIFLLGRRLSCEKRPKYLGFVLDQEILGCSHIDNLVLRGKQRLKVMKFISGRDWGADALTLRNTYTALIRPILEYGFQVYQAASASNLDKLERIQLSAARIITGLRNTCPRDIVLYEADLQPLRLRSKFLLARYFTKLLSYGDQHRTSIFIRNWSNNRRLKRDSPLSCAEREGWLHRDVEHVSLTPCSDVDVSMFGNVSFNSTLCSYTNKNTQHPNYLKQLALETIHGIPDEALQIYTDGSRGDGAISGSGVYVKQSRDSRISRRNPNHCSVFRAELIAIDEALHYCVSAAIDRDIWILCDSRSAIQHLSEWWRHGDQTTVAIVQKLKQVGANNRITFQWVPSHVGIYGNEIADGLAKEGSLGAPPACNTLTFEELATRVKIDIHSTWRSAPVHEWYACSRPGAALVKSFSRREQTALARLRSGHLRTLTFELGAKVFPLCPKCTSAQLSPSHALLCIGCHRNQLYSCPDRILDLLRSHELMDMI